MIASFEKPMEKLLIKRGNRRRIDRKYRSKKSKKEQSRKLRSCMNKCLHCYKAVKCGDVSRYYSKHVDLFQRLVLCRSCDYLFPSAFDSSSINCSTSDDKNSMVTIAPSWNVQFSDYRKFNGSDESPRSPTSLDSGKELSTLGDQCQEKGQHTSLSTGSLKGSVLSMDEFMLNDFEHEYSFYA